MTESTTGSTAIPAEHQAVHYAALAIHHPRPAHREEWIDVMRQVRAAASGVPGLIEATGYSETHSGRLVGLSRWESRKALDAVLPAAIERASECDRLWADRPTDVLVLELIA